MIQISCSIVLFNNQVSELRKAIDSFLNCPLNIRLYLVDNSGDDRLRFEFISPRIEYIFPGRNLGFGAGHNLAINKARKLSRYHLILNPDVEFNHDTITALFRFMEKRQDIGLVMPKVLYHNGDLQYLCKRLPSPSDLFARRFVPTPVKQLFKRFFDTYELKNKDYDSPMDVPNLSGCFMFIRTEVFQQVGLFDEQYFLYFEDTDLCRRINSRYRTVYYPRVSIIHSYHKGSYHNLKLLKYHLRSAVKYFNKWGWLNDKSRIAINRALQNNIPVYIKATKPEEQPEVNIGARKKLNALFPSNNTLLEHVPVTDTPSESAKRSQKQETPVHA